MADDLSRVYDAVAAGESADEVRRLIDDCAQGSDERRAQAVNKEGGPNNDETPLRAAHRQKRGDLVGALVEAGADVSGLFEGRLTPLAVCIMYGQAESVLALLEAGNDPLEMIWRDPGGDDDADTFCSAAHFCLAPARVNFSGNCGPPQLGCLEVLLREGGAEVANARDCYDQTPLFWLDSRRLGEADQRAALDLLLAAGARASGVFDNCGHSPLMDAVSRGNTRLVRLLVEVAGVPVDERSPQGGKTALHLSCHTGMLSLLLAAGADVEARDKWGRTPLTFCAWSARAAPAQLLLDRGASVDVIDDNGRTPLIEACERARWLADDDHWAVLQELLRRSSAETRRARRHLDGGSAADALARCLAAGRALLAGGPQSEEQERFESRLFWLLGELLASGVAMLPANAAAVVPIAAVHAARKDAEAAARRAELGTGWRGQEAFVRLALDAKELREAQRDLEERRAAVLALELELCELGAGTTDTSSSGGGSGASDGEESDGEESDGEEDDESESEGEREGSASESPAADEGAGEGP